jgi:hypothetical protein
MKDHISLPVVFLADGEEALNRAVREWNSRNPDYPCELARAKDGQITAILLPEQIGHRAAFEVGRMMTTHLLKGREPLKLPIQMDYDDDPLLQLEALEAV